MVAESAGWSHERRDHVGLYSSHANTLKLNIAEHPGVEVLVMKSPRTCAESVARMKKTRKMLNGEKEATCQGRGVVMTR
jgi:hypothetical protein